MRIEPSIYLDALMNDFLLWGGKVVIRKFETPRDVAALQRERRSSTAPASARRRSSTIPS